MKNLSVLLSVIFVIGLATVSHAEKMVDPAMEFLIADGSASPSGYGYPDVYANIVTWQENGYGGIYYKNLSTGQQQRIVSEDFNYDPSIYGENIVWENTHWPDGRGGIYSFKISTGELSKLTYPGGYTQQWHANIHGQYVVWQWDHFPPNQLYQTGVSGINLSTGETYDVFTGTNGSASRFPDVYGDVVVWMHGESGSGVYAKNLSTGETWEVADTRYVTEGTQIYIHGDFVVWNGQNTFEPGAPSYWDSYGANLSTGEVFPIDTDPLYNSWVTDIYGEIVIWRKYIRTPDIKEFSLWATDVISGESFLIGEDAGSGKIYEDLIVYSRDGSIYGNYIIEVPDPVPLDIKPQLCPNPLNTKSRGSFLLAILGTVDIDVRQIDVATVELEGVSPIWWRIKDVATPFEPFIQKEDAFDCTNEGPDGFLDLTLKFDTQEVIAAIGDVEDEEVLVLTLIGSLLEEFGGTPIEGKDVVIIQKKGKK